MLGEDGRRKGLVRFAADQLAAHKSGRLTLTPEQERRARGVVEKAALPPRSASELLDALGDPECRPDTEPPSPELLLEIRRCLRLKQSQLGWLLGAKTRNSKLVSIAERGGRPLQRPHRLLLRRLLEDVKAVQTAELALAGVRSLDASSVREL